MLLFIWDGWEKLNVGRAYPDIPTCVSEQRCGCWGEQAWTALSNRDTQSLEYEWTHKLFTHRKSRSNGTSNAFIHNNNHNENLLIYYHYISIIPMMLFKMQNKQKAPFTPMPHNTEPYLNKSLVKEIIQSSQVPLICDVRAESWKKEKDI